MSSQSSTRSQVTRPTVYTSADGETTSVVLSTGVQLRLLTNGEINFPYVGESWTSDCTYRFGDIDDLIAALQALKEAGGQRA